MGSAAILRKLWLPAQLCSIKYLCEVSGSGCGYNTSGLVSWYLSLEKQTLRFSISTLFSDI